VLKECIPASCCVQRWWKVSGKWYVGFVVYRVKKGQIKSLSKRSVLGQNFNNVFFRSTCLQDRLFLKQSILY
jgi:hypothetical protein